jgi:triacylglycerol lipase
MTDIERRRRVLALGRSLTPALVSATSQLYKPLHAAGPWPDVIVEREAYGPHDRHRLAVFHQPSAAGLPTLVFVTGGGLMAPIMAEPDSPFFDNVALWAARNGMVGIAVTCRLAPEAKWPAGAEDVAMALAFVAANAPRYGGDPSRIILMGHSAGAGHVATCVANPSFGHVRASAIVLVSGPYDILTLPGGPNRAYYGDDPSRYPACNTVPALARGGLPLLLAVAENDPPEFELQAVELMSAWHLEQGRLPRFVRLAGHNHVSIAQHIGACESALTRELLDLARTEV